MTRSLALVDFLDEDVSPSTEFHRVQGGRAVFIYDKRWVGMVERRKLCFSFTHKRLRGK